MFEQESDHHYCKTVHITFQTKSKKFQHQLKLPAGVVKKLEKQKGGIFPIISTVEREFGLEVNYVRDKHLVLFGPSMEVLDLMAQTLILRYVIKVRFPIFCLWTERKLRVFL